MFEQIEPRPDFIAHRPSKSDVESSSLSSPTTPQPHAVDPNGLWFTSIEHPAEPLVRVIPLTQNQVALVDAADFDWLNQWKWCAAWNVPARSFRAMRSVRVDGVKRITYMHRVILGLDYGDPRQGDHVNHDTLNNTRTNLRIATRAQNQWNQRLPRNSTSGYKGVAWITKTKKWHAQIHLGNKSIFLGNFPTPQLAHAAYCEAATQYYGEFANSGGAA